MITDKQLSRIRDSGLRELSRELRRTVRHHITDPWDCIVRAADDYAIVTDAMYRRCPEMMDDVQREQAELAERMQGLVSVTLGLSAMVGPTDVCIDFKENKCSVSAENHKADSTSFDDEDGEELKRMVLMLHPEIIEDRSEKFECTLDLIPYGGCTFAFSDGSSLYIPSYLLNRWFTGGLVDLVSSFCDNAKVPIPDLRYGILSSEYLLLLDNDRFEKLYKRIEADLFKAIFDEDEKSIEKMAYDMCVLRKEAKDRSIILDDKEIQGISLRGDYDDLTTLGYETDGLSVMIDLKGMALIVNGEMRRISCEDVQCILEQLTHCYLNLHTSETTEDAGTITMTYWDGKVQTVDQRDLMDPLGAVYPLFCGLEDIGESESNL